MVSDDEAREFRADVAARSPRAPKDAPTVGEQLRRAIEECGLSHRALAAEVGVDHRVIDRFVARETDLMLGIAGRICRALGLRLAETGRPARRGK